MNDKLHNDKNLYYACCPHCKTVLVQAQNAPFVRRSFLVFLFGSLIFNSEESFNFRTVKKVVSQRSKKRQKISEFSQKTRIKISNAILVADFKC